MKKDKLYSSKMTDEQIKKVRESAPELFSGDNANISQFSISIESLDVPETLYHYTSIDTLERILNDSIDKEHFTLRGTHFEYLNDYQELNLAINLIQEVAKEFESQGKDTENKNISEWPNEKWKSLSDIFETKSGPFITSFSENADSLPMWNH